MEMTYLPKLNHLPNKLPSLQTRELSLVMLPTQACQEKYYRFLAYPLILSLLPPREVINGQPLYSQPITIKTFQMQTQPQVTPSQSQFNSSKKS